MMELDLTRTRLGVIAISAAAVNDVVGWLLLALVTTLTVSEFAAVFTMLVIMAIFSTVITTPALRHYLPRVGLGQSGIGVEDAAGDARRGG
jgi:Kef-type K+ transport system membrane component KefB